MNSTLASGFQRSKAAYLEQERQLQTLVEDTEFQTHFQTWLDATISQLDVQFDACEQTLSELQQNVRVDDGTYWNAKTLTQHCNLAIPENRLLNTEAKLKEGEHIGWHDLMLLNETLLGLTKKLPDQDPFLRGVMDEIAGKHVVFAPREMAIIARSMEAKLGDETADSASQTELERIQRQVEKFTPDLREIEHLIEDSLHNGDIALAVDQSYKQLDWYEAQLTAILQQYPVITRRHTDNVEQQRRRRWHIFRMANRDISSVMEAKLRQIEACQDDQRRIDEQVANYSNDDVYQRKRYMLDREQSDEYLEENKQQQRRVWNKINDLYTQLIASQSELGQLARSRVDEVERRLRIEEREAGRRSGHAAFKSAAERRTKLLQDTVKNAERAFRLAKTLNAFALDQCDSVAAKYDVVQGELQERLQRLRHTHVECFHEYYLKASRLIDRKEHQLKRAKENADHEAMQLELKTETLNPEAKRHAQERDKIAAWCKELERDTAMLRERVQQNEARVRDLAYRPFERLGVPYLHPSAIAGQITVIRSTKVLDIRDNLVQAGDDYVQLAAQERELDDLRRRRDMQTTEKLQVVASRIPRVPQVAGEESRRNYARYEKLVDKVSPAVASVMPPRPPTTVAYAAEDAAHSPLMMDSGFAGHSRADPRHRIHTGAAPHAPAPPTTTLRGATGPTLRDGCNVRALFTYKGTDEDELTFNRGDEFLCVTRAVDDGWYIGVHKNRQGIFPANYVRASD
jgi:hypothetical protein